MDAKDEEILPKNWVKRVSKSREGKTYFWNTKTKKSVWYLKDVIALDKEGKGKDGIQKPIKKNIAADRMKKLRENLRNGKIPVKVPMKDTEKRLEVKPLKQSPLKKRKVQESNHPSKPSVAVNETKSPIIVDLKEKLPQSATKKQKLDPRQRVLVKEISGNSVKRAIPEPMDWDEIPEELILREIASLRNFDDIDVDVEMKPIEDLKPHDNLDAFETIEQYLNYKSLILEDQFDARQFFIVIDTNVFISNLDFIVDLPRAAFKAGTPTIVIPYIVLQELDKLKNVRSDERLAMKAKTAISVLNVKFQTKDSGFVGQSTMDNAKELIQIDNADDQILNCVLQQQKMGNVVLLSNDINLRNKAIVNSIDAFSAKQLEEKRDTLDFL